MLNWTDSAFFSLDGKSGDDEENEWKKHEPAGHSRFNWNKRQLQQQLNAARFIQFNCANRESVKENQHTVEKHAHIRSCAHIFPYTFTALLTVFRVFCFDFDWITRCYREWTTGWKWTHELMRSIQIQRSFLSVSLLASQQKKNQSTNLGCVCGDCLEIFVSFLRFSFISILFARCAEIT